jgi:hypothetical protein
MFPELIVARWVSAMGEFLMGTSWGLWFVLAAIIAAEWVIERSHSRTRRSRLW